MKYILNKIISKFQSLSLLQEAADLNIDNFELEHWLFYNNLSGSFDDNKNKKIKNLKQDIIDGFQFKSQLSLSIALKVHPLPYAKILLDVFKYISQNFPDYKNLLLPTDIESLPQNCLFTNEDWMVRANLVNILSSLNIVESVPFIKIILHKAFENIQPDFLYAANALANLSPAEALKVLPQYLNSHNIWLKTDAAYALSNINNSRDILLKTVLANSSINDYLSEIIANKNKIEELLALENTDLFACACEIVYQLRKIANSDMRLKLNNNQYNFVELTNIISQKIRNKTSVVSLWALFNLFEANSISYNIFDIIPKDNLFDLISVEINRASNETSELNFNHLKLKRSINLIEKYKFKEFRDDLLKKLDLQYLFCEDVIQALASLDEFNELYNFSRKIIDTGKRYTGTKLVNDIVESDHQFYKIYSSLIRVFAWSKDKTHLEFLCLSLNDYAPNIRKITLESLVTFVDTNNLHNENLFNQAVTGSLNDPCYHVNILGIQASHKFKHTQNIDLIINHLKSPQRSVREESCLVLNEWSKTGLSKEITIKIKNRIAFEYNFTNRSWLNKALEQLENNNGKKIK